LRLGIDYGENIAGHGSTNEQAIAFDATTRYCSSKMDILFAIQLFDARSQEAVLAFSI